MGNDHMVPSDINPEPHTDDGSYSLQELPEWIFDWCIDPKPKRPQPWCPYKHPRAWRSVYGPHLICGTCHPPASESVVAEWLNRKK